MSQPTGYPGSGLRFGNSFVILSGAGDPSASSTVDVIGASLNSVFFRTDAPDASHWIYRCSTAAVFANGTLVSAAQWTAH
jgi:hypothetical protein